MRLFWVDGIAQSDIEIIISCFELRRFEQDEPLPNQRTGKIRETFAPWWQRWICTPWSWQAHDDRHSLTVWPACKEWMLAGHTSNGAVEYARGTSRLVRRYTVGNEHLYITDTHTRVVERLLAT